MIIQIWEAVDSLSYKKRRPAGPPDKLVAKIVLKGEHDVEVETPGGFRAVILSEENPDKNKKYRSIDDN